MPESLTHGILNIDKPRGITSHDVVATVRRLAGQKKIGHCGTLDPIATGVLLVCLGDATRLAEYLVDGEKRYRATVRLGVTTDTFDCTGQILHETEVTSSQIEAQAALASLVGRREQTTPMYSAAKHHGTPLYRLARKGIVVQRAQRIVDVYALNMTAWAPPELEFIVHCGKGTYVRALAHELGLRLGCGAHLVALRREAVGRFTIAEAVTLDTLTSAVESGTLYEHLLPMDVAVEAFPSVTVDEALEHRIQLGQSVTLEESPSSPLCMAHTGGGRLLAILRRSGAGRWQPHKVFWGSSEHASHT